MPVYDAQTSFAGGEISPDLYGRTDLAKIKIGCRTLRNFIPSPHGPAYNRPGTQYIATTKTTGKKVRLVDFVFSTTQSYVLEFGEHYIRFYRNGAQIQSGGGAYEVTTTYAEADLFNLKFTQSADTIYIAHNSYPPKILQRITDTSWSFGNYPFSNGPFQFPNTTSTRLKLTAFFGGYFLDNVDTTFDAPVGTGVSYECNLPISGQSYIDDVGGAAFKALDCGNTWRLVTTGTWTGTITVTVKDPQIAQETLATYKSNNDLNVNTFGAIDLIDGYIPRQVTVNLNISGGTCHVNFTTDPFVATIYFGGPVASTTRIIGNIDSRYAFVTDLSTILFSDWAEGSWSTFRGFPGVVAFYQDRLVWANSSTEPQTVWLSRTSDYVNFARSSPLVDDDGITVNLLSRQVNAINSMKSFLNTCVLFTDGSEWSISSSSDGGITPTTIQVKLQGNRGNTSAVDPVFIGNRLIFIEPLGSTVRDMEYQYFTNTYNTENISTYSNHLFAGHSIVAMAYQQEPDSLLWLVRDDGILLCCTYMREQEVLAWSHHDTYDGAHLFESICSIPGTNGTELWCVVRRGTKRYVERITLRTISTDPADQFFVDCGATYSGAAVGSVSGYNYLNGFNAAINAEGFVLPQQAISVGTITFDKNRSKAQFGLSITDDFEGLNPDFQLPDGAFQARKYQINRAVIRFLKTIGGYAGGDLSTLDSILLAGQPVMRDASLAATTPTPLFSDFVSIPIRATNDLRSHVAIRQVDPMPMTILSVMSVVGPGQMP